MLEFHDSDQQYLVFQLSQEWFVLPLSLTRGIERWRTITLVPDTPPEIVGLINQRGILITVIDARISLGLKINPPDRNTRLIIVHTHHGDCAIIADRVSDILTLDSATIESAPSRGSNLSSALIMTPLGQATVLDLDSLIQTIVNSKQ